MNANNYMRRKCKPRKITKNEQARADLIKAGYRLLEDCCGSGQVTKEAELDRRSNLYSALYRARYKHGYKDVTYTVGAGLRYASQGYYFFVGGKN
jgi:hypothetical protein